MQRATRYWIIEFIKLRFHNKNDEFAGGGELNMMKRFFLDYVNQSIVINVLKRCFYFFIDIWNDISKFQGWEDLMIKKAIGQVRHDDAHEILNVYFKKWQCWF